MDNMLLEAIMFIVLTGFAGMFIFSMVKLGLEGRKCNIEIAKIQARRQELLK